MNGIHRETISRVEFRWRHFEEEFARRLAEAARGAGRSQPDHARELLKNALTASDVLQQAVESLQQDVAQVYDQLRQLVAIKKGIRIVHEDVRRLRDDIAACLAEVLVEAGRLDPKDAERWVKKTFNAD